ncbi:Dak1 domain-containing protein [Lentinula aff. detonsa]|uniref:Dak1 domain-containing protein n=1 Tax=Lentinula aff. detonsa TaxID=2804958 RepID=A0AA38NBX9_9AGAR|nr:Dak1 domain-containing protein [Lentinula aff. detonsa]KAJ3794401.1 Dak1 domain-containing protein [Lentinula aff. detonsa]
MASKHLINSPSTLVIESLEGLCLLNPELKLDRDARVLFLPMFNSPLQKVALICGGGSGHEPAHAAFVGKGLLSAAVSGSVFASPSGKQVRRAVELVHLHNSTSDGIEQGAGTLIIVKNYTGDILNFGLAKEALASFPTYANSVRFLTVADDVSVPRSRITLVGRRGLAGTVLVYKIAGELATRGASLDEVEKIGQYVTENLATIGVATGHSHVPGTERGQDALGKDEIEIGMGIHNEPGVLRLRGSNGAPPPLSEIMPRLITLLTASQEEDPERGWVSFLPSTDIVLMVNNLGGLSPLELSAVLLEATETISQKGLRIKRVLCGTYMTSLNMPGFSLTLLKLPSMEQGTGQGPSQDLIISLLDASPEAPGWGWISRRPPVALSEQVVTSVSFSSRSSSSSKFSSITNEDAKGIVGAIKRACNALIHAEPELTRMDTVAGDGDCGLTLKAGAEGVLALLLSNEISGNNLSDVFVAIAGVAEDKMGGTSGGLYSIFFSALAQGLQPSSSTMKVDWPYALHHALTKLYTYTRARPPSRTLVDPLDAFVNSLHTEKTDSMSALKKAQEAARATRGMQAKAGRAVYGGGEGGEGEMDPGAWGVVVLLNAIVDEEGQTGKTQ